MDELKMLLLALGVSEAKISLLTAEEKPEDFDASEIVKEVVAEREKFYATKLAPLIEKAYEEKEAPKRYAATIKPIQNRLEKLAKNLGATPEELKDVDAKGLTDLIAKKQELAVSTASKASDEDLRKELNAAREKLTTLTDEFKTAKDGHLQELENVRAESVKERNEEIKATGLNRILASDEFKGIKDVGQPDQVLRLYMQKAGYDLEVTEDKKLKPVMLKDRSDAINLDGNATYANATDMLLDVARRNKMFPIHNGGEGKTLSNEMIVGGERKTVGGNVSWLKEQMQ